MLSGEAANTNFVMILKQNFCISEHSALTGSPLSTEKSFEMKLKNIKKLEYYTKTMNMDDPNKNDRR